MKNSAMQTGFVRANAGLDSGLREQSRIPRLTGAATGIGASARPGSCWAY